MSEEMDKGVEDFDQARAALGRFQDTVKSMIEDLKEVDKAPRAPRSERGNQIARERQASRAHFKKEKE